MAQFHEDVCVGQCGQVYAGSHRMRVAITVLGILLCSAATAGPRYWMKKENPEELLSSVYVDDRCAISEEQVREVVDGVVIRSRLKTGDYRIAEVASILRGNLGPSSLKPFGFEVTIDCLQTPPSLFDANVKFVRRFPELNRSLYESAIYSHYGIGSSESILASVKGLVEQLVTDYLQANGAAQSVEQDRYLEHANNALRCYWINQIAIFRGLNLMGDVETSHLDESDLRVIHEYSQILMTSAGIALRNHYVLIGRPLEKPERDAIYLGISESKKESVWNEYAARAVFSEDAIQACAEVAIVGASLINAEIRSRSEN